MPSGAKYSSFVLVALSTSVNTAPNPVTPAATACVPGTLNQTSVTLLPSGANTFGTLKVVNSVG